MVTSSRLVSFFIRCLLLLHDLLSPSAVFCFGVGIIGKLAALATELHKLTQSDQKQDNANYQDERNGTGIKDQSDHKANKSKANSSYWTSSQITSFACTDHADKWHVKHSD